jgi:hypothetical protein
VVADTEIPRLPRLARGGLAAAAAACALLAACEYEPLRLLPVVLSVDPSSASLTVYPLEPRVNENVEITWTGDWRKWGEAGPPAAEFADFDPGRDRSPAGLKVAFDVQMTVPTPTPREQFDYPADEDRVSPEEIPPDGLLYGLWNFVIMIEPSDYGPITCVVEIRAPNEQRVDAGKLQLWAVESSPTCGASDGGSPPPEIAEVAIGDILIDPAPLIPGVPARLRVLVTNGGETQQTVAVSLETAPDPARITAPSGVPGAATARIEGIVVASDQTSRPDDALFVWDTTGLAAGPQTVGFRVDPVERETNVSNNSLAETVVFVSDGDGDRVPDDADNCLTLANPLQTDTDADCFGNRCDPDFDQDGTVGIPDFGFLNGAMTTYDPEADLDSDGDVDADDRAILNAFMGQGPGPSGLCP